LLVEDKAAVRALVGRLLRSNGYIVLEAEHSQAALQLAESYSNTIDLLLIDVALRQINSTTLAKQLLTTRPTSKVRLMSSSTPGNMAHHGRLAIHPPFMSTSSVGAELLRNVRELLDS